MFTLVVNTGQTFRTNLLAEARTFLHAQRPGVEVTIQGLGRVVVRSMEGAQGLVLFYPLGGRGPQDLLLEDVLDMLPAMVEGEDTPEEVQEKTPEDPSEEVWEAVDWRTRRWWKPLREGKRELYISAGGVAYWARNHPPGTRLTLRTQVEIQRPLTRSRG